MSRRKEAEIVVVTRHPALVEYLKEIKMIDSSATIIEHIEDETEIRNKHVIGVLPHHLSCLTALYTEIPLKLPSELRGKELSIEDIRKYAEKPATYVVYKVV